ncbi:PHP domain-containing protein [Cellulomonas sp. ATA003]|uniref:PHP domain-containing protein n=1 Tax=Cellulomonas sp. ATA003 TaxID=3073064 RepID=UPI0028732702|nr:PHP domain-containing protein [Cellulomonas sp. ATA003]WNB84357.1 PHP domain-containing protein [Cellulomonas sp. ATA003]
MGPSTPAARQDDAVATLRRIAFLLERAQATSYRSDAFRKAARAVEAADPGELARLVADDHVEELRDVGRRTAEVVLQRWRDEEVEYLTRLEREVAEAATADGPGAALRSALRGDLHAHTDASDGGSPLQEMVLAAMEIGHEYLVITDHSPRLTVANGLSPARLRRQIAQIRALNEAVAPFRVLTGIEVDILDDGKLDQEPTLLAELDVVVGSVHSKLRMDSAAMTRRMVAAVENPHLDVLGHCTGRRLIGSRPRPPSDFDADAVFAACAEAAVAVEINSRPDRRDPPHALLQSAIDHGCLFSVDSDAHAPGQLDWQITGCERAAQHDLDPARVVNTRDVDGLLAWTGRERG